MEMILILVPHVPVTCNKHWINQVKRAPFQRGQMIR